MLTRLNRAIAITFLLYLITGIDQLTEVRPTPKVATPQQSIGFKALPQPTLEMSTPIELKVLPHPPLETSHPKF